MPAGTSRGEIALVPGITRREANHTLSNKHTQHHHPECSFARAQLGSWLGEWILCQPLTRACANHVDHFCTECFRSLTRGTFWKEPHYLCVLKQNKKSCSTTECRPQTLRLLSNIVSSHRNTLRPDPPVVKLSLIRLSQSNECTLFTVTVSRSSFSALEHTICLHLPLLDEDSRHHERCVYTQGSELQIAAGTWAAAFGATTLVFSNVRLDGTRTAAAVSPKLSRSSLHMPTTSRSVSMRMCWPSSLQMVQLEPEEGSEPVASDAVELTSAPSSARGDALEVALARVEQLRT